MKFSFVSALMAIIAVAAPGAAASDNYDYGVDSYDSELSSSYDYDMYSEDSASSEDMMLSKDEILDNDNTFIGLENTNCGELGPNLCDRRPACEWTCDTRRTRDRHLGCCVRYFVPTPPSRPSPPSRRPPSRNRPSPPSSSGGSSFEDGRSQGRREAERIWRDLGRSCASAWNQFQNSVSRRIRNNGWNSNGNWRTSSFNRGARAGMNEVVAERENECFRDSSDECDELGTEAARILAFHQCRVGAASTSRRSRKNRWRSVCRDEAVTQCRRQMRSQVRAECGSRPNDRDLRNLQSRCRNQVLTMIGDRFDFEEEE